jgi:hypothetical protein
MGFNSAFKVLPNTELRRLLMGQTELSAYGRLQATLLTIAYNMCMFWYNKNLQSVWLAATLL